MFSHIENVVGNFNAAYGRIGIIWLDEHKCDVCEEDKFCLLIDSSEGEYGEGAVCKDCIDKIFKEYE